MTTETSSPPTTTDVTTFIGDLAGGNFERMLSVALSHVAAAVIDTGKRGSVSVSFDFARIPGTKQTNVTHSVKFVKPTEAGRSIEEGENITVMHVGRGGRLTLAPESQLNLFGTAGQAANSQSTTE